MVTFLFRKKSFRHYNFSYFYVWKFSGRGKNCKVAIFRMVRIFVLNLDRTIIFYTILKRLEIGERSSCSVIQQKGDPENSVLLILYGDVLRP